MFEGCTTMGLKIVPLETIDLANKLVFLLFKFYLM